MEDVIVLIVVASGTIGLYCASFSNIKAGGNVNQAKTDSGSSPLYIASQNGNEATVKVLLNAGGNVNQAQTTTGCTPLFQASQNGHVDTVKVLIKAGGKVNQARTTDGVSPL